MIKLKSNDPFLLSSITNLLLQKDLLLTELEESFYTPIIISKSENLLILKIKDEIINFNLPINLNTFVSKIIQIISEIRLSIGLYDYFPYQRAIYSKSKKLILTDIQNKIIFSLVSCKVGISKILLYKLIWDNDKDIYINKLDTHLTNLKNQIRKDLNMNINFQSQDKILKLLID